MTLSMLPFILSFVSSPFGPPFYALDLSAGRGVAVERGCRYSVAYRLDDTSGKVLANSDSRGLPFSKELGDGHDRYFDEWVIGMKAGGVRQIVLAGKDVPRELWGVVPEHADLVVTVRLLGIRRPNPR